MFQILVEFWHNTKDAQSYELAIRPKIYRFVLETKRAIILSQINQSIDPPHLATPCTHFRAPTGSDYPAAPYTPCFPPCTADCPIWWPRWVKSEKAPSAWHHNCDSQQDSPPPAPPALWPRRTTTACWSLHSRQGQHTEAGIRANKGQCECGETEWEVEAEKAAFIQTWRCNASPFILGEFQAFARQCVRSVLHKYVGKLWHSNFICCVHRCICTRGTRIKNKVIYWYNKVMWKSWC